VRVSATRSLIAALTIAALLGAASSALADPPADSPSREGKALGILPSRGQAAKFARTNTSNLSWHAGPVMHGNAVYAIYWFPTGSTFSNNYQSLTNRYFTDVGVDNGQSTNVYYSDTQYYDGSGNVPYSSSLAAATVDTNAFPQSGCSDRYTPAKCLTDGQIQSEIQRVISTTPGWSGGMDKIFFLFTPKNVGSCYGSTCAFSYYCAYHSWIGSGGPGTILYANMPYAATVPAACDSGQHPNGDEADATINLVSHEHNETITDPLGNAWYDRNGNENGDKCAWNFGAILGGSTSAGTAFNQSIDNLTPHSYYLQQEWSNAHSRCVLTGT
jgi:hypothetical protein